MCQRLQFARDLRRQDDVDLAVFHPGLCGDAAEHAMRYPQLYLADGLHMTPAIPDSLECLDGSGARPEALV